MQYTKQINREIKTDVLVIGGGSAGFGAAVASARNGAETLLIERAQMMGGMATAGLVGPFMTCYDDGPTEQIVKGIFDELCVRTEERGGAVHPSKVGGMTPYSSYYVRSHCHVTPFLSETLEIVMEEMVIEAGAKILYNVQMCDVLTDNGTITGILVSMKEGLTLITAKTYIDCTGDADAAYYAGAECVAGDEKDGVMQPVTLFFEVGNIDRDKFIGALEERKANGELGIPGENCWSWYIKEARANGDWDIERNEIGNYEQPVKGRFKINTTRIAHIDATNTEQITAAVMEGRKQVQKVMKFLQKYVPGCEEIQLLQVASTLGVRETRHIKGRYKLTAQDIMERKHFDDAICTFAYAIDIHNSEGGGATFQQVNGYYTIPFGCLVPENVGNLLVAGRCISGTSEAAASYRVIPCCIATGQAAGTAAALALKAGKLPGDVDISELRKVLVEQGAVIKD
ncbi:FAD-dependent oxidoreductase [Clostridium sp. MCC353]|uniref:FAD-dependent oxidoreductase n=1 Tax=Clostridium sp. MCC353 TaxID=2592646 RepID=UPI001C01F2D2|nr:FAD-dependent oxidoreductase [Clostridium sp. MCC353]MBT9776371.1 FAD-dependent oxidoreductase [Clostridium sp. MCC353]